MKEYDQQMNVLAELYRSGQCTEEQEKEWEKLLLEDDEVLELYMNILHSEESNLPELSDPQAFAEGVMLNLPELQLASLDQARKKKLRWFEQPFFHYVVAASVTLIFLSNGLFDRIMPERINEEMEHMDAAPYSEQLLHLTTDWLDKLKK